MIRNDKKMRTGDDDTKEKRYLRIYMDVNRGGAISGQFGWTD